MKRRAKTNQNLNDLLDVLSEFHVMDDTHIQIVDSQDVEVLFH